MYEKFNQLLQEHNVTAYRVSKDTGISTATLSDWKNGKSEPKKDKIQKLADYFEVPITYFYDVNLDIETRENLKEEQVNRLTSYSVAMTVAAHKKDNENWTPNEIEKIEEYKKLLMAARKNQK